MRTKTITVGHVAAPIWGSGNLVRTCAHDANLRCPGLAESWEANADFTQWTFKVRSNVLWHDGTPFTAQDVKFWLDLQLFPSQGRARSSNAVELGDVKSVDILDSNRVRINLNRPSPNYVVTAGQPFMYLAHPRHLTQRAIEKGNPTVAPVELGLVGTGPFVFKEHIKGSVVSVRRFDRYWEKDKDGRQLPYLDGIDFPIIPDANGAMAAFRVGRVDGGIRGNYLLPELKQSIEKTFGDRVYFVGDARGGTRNIGFNILRTGPWQDVRVRKAISLWVDRKQWGETVRGGGGGVPRGFFHPDTPYANPDYLTWPGFNPATRAVDRAEAKRLLAEAGYPKGFKASFLCRSVNWVPECEFFTEQMRTLGLDITIDIRGIADYEAANLAGNFDLAIGGGGQAGFPEAYRNAIGSLALYGSSTTRHNDAKVDEYFTRIDVAASQDERIRLSRELERYLLLDKVYLVTSWTEVYWQPFRTYVKGVLDPLAEACNFCDYATVWLDK
jgi:peptide/nickel transport system substrate-binding protein